MAVLSLEKDFIDVHFWYRARSRLIVHYLKRWRAEPVLEIGAGSGVVLVALRAAGFNIAGVDIAHYPNTLDLSIRYGQDAFLLPSEERQIYKALALFDVLEHISDRIYFLRQLRSHFVNQRYLYLTVPAREELYGVDDERLGHYLRYTPQKLQSELEEAGYKVLYWSYWFHVLYWILRRKVQRRESRGPAVAPKVGSPSRLFHRLLANYFYWEGRLLPSTWRGTSLFCVAQPDREKDSIHTGLAMQSSDDPRHFRGRNLPS